ncbi:hypothetical protein HYC85_011586 [Camellia sinensis]|uniref:Response regulatory domain-containing protein n=1 Tax=Camellia sinensis TaxID=4442 RepID=A0A7J7H9F6_CAMSI|nr:hypothetical protein HYC85_011586 [Camellia sinensis]
MFMIRELEYRNLTFRFNGTENALPTLFKKYMQVGADMARKYGGTGLGLAICKQLVELMGGHLSVSSREHHGSTFTLPYKVSPAADNSDDPDELSDMVDHDAPDDANDDDTSSEFFNFNHALWVTSLEDACSVDGANTSLEYESSIRDNPDSAKKIAVGSDSEIQCHNKENGKFHNPDMNSTHPSRENNIGETIKAIDSQEASEMWEKTNRSTQCSASNSPEIPKSMFKPKILLVEDNKINVMVTRSMMKQLGHTIDVVNNGVEAVRAVQSCTYDLVQMDVCMPVMDGLQATRLIRSFEETGSWDAAVKAGIEQFVPTNDQKFESSKKRMPIIAMTANALAESADECFANGMDSNQPGVKPSSNILDASEAPSLVWQLEEGYLSSSSESSSEPEFDSTESVELESDSGSSESEFGVPAGDNPDAKLVVTEELDKLDLMNKNAATDSEYFRVILRRYASGIDPTIVQHRIPLDPMARPIKHKLQIIRPDWALKIQEEVTKQIEVGFLLVSEYPTWLANIVPVPKKDGKIWVCVDFKDLNKASPKDDFSLTHIDELVDFTTGHVLLSFMDGFSEYNQILMAPKDREKIAFTTP